MSGIALLRRLLMKQAMKKSAPFQHEGIMSINKNLVNDVERQVSRWVESAKRQGADIDKMSEQELKYIIELNKPKGPMIGEHRVIDATSPEGKGITESLFGKKPADVLDLSGKKIDTSKPILGGKNVPEDIVTDTVIIMKKMTPMDAMKEANLVIARKGKYKNLTIDESQDILKKTNDHIFERDIKYDEFGEIIKPDPEDLAYGGIAGMLGEPTYEDDNHRVPYGAGGMGRRLFLKLMGGAAAGTAATKSGLFSLLKASKPTAQVLTSVPIKAGVDGMPVWFKPLVNKIIKTGDEVESGMERVIVHSSELPGSKTKLFVTQELDTGNVMVDVGIGKHGFGAGHHGQPVRLEYKAAEDIMTGPDADDLWKIGERDPHVKTKSRKEFQTNKTKEEFWVEEAEFTGGHPENIKFEESVSEKFGSHGSNFDEVEKFATGKIKKKTAKESIKAERAHWTPEGDMASGGRVPLADGKKVADPGYFIHNKNRYEYDPSGPKTIRNIREVLEEIKDMYEKEGIIERKIFSEKDRMPPKNYFLEAMQNPEIYFPENTPEELKNIKRNLRLKQEVKDGGRVPSSGGLAGMLGE